MSETNAYRLYQIRFRQQTIEFKLSKPLITVFKVLLILVVLYIFLVSIGLMGGGFKFFGKDFARALIETTSNPFIGLFIGIFATALIQSSSTTTSMVVAFVAAGTISVQNAIPVIMGANIGTAVTSTLVSLGHVTRQREFERAFAAGTVHDMFNLMVVLILLPIEIATGYLHRTASALASVLAGTSGIEFKSPLKLITKPISKEIIHGISSFGFTQIVSGVLIVIIGIGLLMISLIVLSKLLKSLVLSKLQRILHASTDSSGIIAILIGVVFTVIVQSSSVTTSLMIPMAAAGILTIRHVFPVALGANVGTTITALLASLATGRPEALTIALVHLLFNISGILLFYPVPFMRQIPITVASGLAKLVMKKRSYAILFILIGYFFIPGLAIFLT